MKRAKRAKRRLLGVVIGLCLGWYAAGLAPLVFDGQPTQADDQPAPKTAPETADNAPAKAPEADPGNKKAGETPGEKDGHKHKEGEAHKHKEGEHKKGEHHEHAGSGAAGRLVPRDADGNAAAPGWYGTVVTLIIALFVAAVVIGVPALRMKGPDPVEEDDHHDDDHH